MADYTYTYDELGRLRAVVDSAGDFAIYVYDDVGNILSIERQSSSIVSIIEFTPKNAPVGTPITIQGTGFSTTPGQNTVTFNGVPATVVSAIKTQLITTVPSAATTGILSVSTPTGSATTDTAFTLVSPHEAPAITGFNPRVGIPGTLVSLAGTGFASVFADNRVAFNGTLAALNAVNSVTIDAVVPIGAGSGRIAITTPFGKTVSSDDFFIPPPPNIAEDVEFTGRATIGDDKLVTIDLENKIALVVFEGNAKQRISLDITNVTIARSSVSIYGPDLTSLLLPLSVTDNGKFIEPITLPLSGTYSILVDPEETNTGNLTLTLHDVPPDFVGGLLIGGPSVRVNTVAPGQKARLTFEGTSGQQLNMGISEVSLGGDIGVFEVAILRPDGTTFAKKFAGRFDDDIDIDFLPESGTYTIVLDPQEEITLDVTLTLSEPVTGTIVIDGPSVPVVIGRAGQNASLTFEGVVGQLLNLGISEVSLGTSNALNVSILRPDKTILSSLGTGVSGRDMDAVSLPDAGTYTMVIDPDRGSTARLILTLSEPINIDVPIDGLPKPVTLDRPGQDARLMFEGTASQQIKVSISDVDFSDSTIASGGTVSILNPDEVALASTVITTSGGDILTGPLPKTGTYSILVDPGVLAVSLNLTLSEPN